MSPNACVAIVLARSVVSCNRGSQVVPAPASGDAGQAKPPPATGGGGSFGLPPTTDAAYTPPATTGARVCKVPRESLDGTLGTCTRAAPRYWLRHNTFRTSAQIDGPLECRPPGID